MTDLTEDYAKAGFGGRLAFGARPVLLLVDVVCAYVEPDSPLYSPPFVDALRSNERLVAVARAAGVPVVFTGVAYQANGLTGGVFYRKVPALKAFDPGSELAKFPDSLQPRDGEPVVLKQYASAFFGTSLASMLTAMGCDTVIVTGFSTSGCVRASALDAMQHGFLPFVVREACGDRDPGPHEANLFDLQAKYAEVVSEAEAMALIRRLAVGRNAAQRLTSRQGGAMSGGARTVFSWLTAAVAASLSLAACGGGGETPSSAATPSAPATAISLSLYAVPAQEALTAAEVAQIVAQAAEEANARSLPAVVAVTDRVGNVLAVYAMTGARATATLRANPNGNTDFEGVAVPATLAAISKAITGAYLSSSGNAFSTRTASMIVQEHFPPSAATVGLESGPLFGVQFSQLPCSDFSQRFPAAPTLGPKRAPLGLAADPGGLPLYKNGVVVGGIGVMADGDYGLDREVRDVDNDAEEQIAAAGSLGFAAPSGVRAERISVDGTLLRYADSEARRFAGTARPLAGIAGAFTPVTGYFAGAILAGTPYGSEASGVRKASAAEFGDPDAFIFTDGAGVNRYPPRGGTDAGDVASPLSAAEARALLEEAFKVMARARAQIRQPVDGRAQVTISVVDTRGAVLGMVRSPDAPIFGADVSLQKARTVAFFSGARAAGDLSGATRAAGAPDVNVLDFVPRFATFLSPSGALTGQVAFADRSIGNLARPYYPDGEVGRPNGPLSRPIANFSPFSTGLQSALLVDNIVQHATYVASAGASADTRQRCTFLPDAAAGQNRLQNGIQIFPGGVPVYRGNVLVGAVGVSGDGIDQDDMIAFLGTNNAGLRVGGIGNAPAAIRADRVVVPVGAGVRLRYVSCPFAPFLDTAQQNVCQGL